MLFVVSPDPSVISEHENALQQQKRMKSYYTAGNADGSVNPGRLLVWITVDLIDFGTVVRTGWREIRLTPLLS